MIVSFQIRFLSCSDHFNKLILQKIGLIDGVDTSTINGRLF